MKLGDKLKNLRLEKEMSLEELATAFNSLYGFNLSRSTMSRWENGLREPTMSYLGAYAMYFNVSLDWLLDLKNSENYDINPITLKHVKVIEENPKLIELVENAKDLSNQSIDKACDFLKFLRTQEKEEKG